VSAPALESAVLEQIRGITGNPTVLGKVLDQIEGHRQQDAAAATKEKTAIEGELKKIAQEMGSVVSVAGKAEFTTNRLADLQDRVTHLNDRLMELRRQLVAIDAEHTDPRDVAAALHEFDPLWGQLSTWEQERFIRTLVEQVRYDGKTGTVTLGFRSHGIKDLCTWAPAVREKYEHAEQRG
jgi:site-specific DNA recombinase